jgi:TIR domain
MEIFLSWSGRTSRSIAEKLDTWIPDIIQNVNFFFSKEDIGSGQRWALVLGENLDRCDFGLIICTPDNLTAPWLLFEAGALSKKLSSARVCPLLFGTNHQELADPLQQFQMSAFNKDNFYKLMREINTSLKDQRVKEDRLERLFETMWPDLEDTVNSILESSVSPQMNFPTDSNNLDPVQQLKNLDVFTFCGIRNDIVLKEIEDADDLEQIYFLWADATKGSTVSSQVFQNDAEKFIRIKFNNESITPSNVAIRPGGIALVHREERFHQIRFKARIPHNIQQTDLKKVQISIRVIDALTTHWKYILRTGRDDCYEPLIVEASNPTDEWIDFQIELNNRAKWQVFESDGNWKYHAPDPEFTSILAIIIEVGSTGNKGVLPRPSEGQGIVDVKDFTIN